MEYILYCDESSSQGKIFTDFFGGCILPATKQRAIEDALNLKKQQLNLNAEVKWTKVTENYLEKYIELIHLFFDFVRAQDIHIRIMFRKTEDQYERNATPIKDERYFKLYYQFLKHSFGFTTSKSITGEYYVHFLIGDDDNAVIIIKAQCFTIDFHIPIAIDGACVVVFQDLFPAIDGVDKIHNFMDGIGQGCGYCGQGKVSLSASCGSLYDIQFVLCQHFRLDEFCQVFRSNHR